MAKITIPESQSELEELLSDGAKVQALQAEGQFPDVVKAYAKKIAEKDQELQAQIKVETQRVLAEYLRENENLDALKLMEKGGVDAFTTSARAHFQP